MKASKAVLLLLVFFLGKLKITPLCLYSRIHYVAILSIVSFSIYIYIKIKFILPSDQQEEVDRTRFPAWVLHPDVERVSFLNSLLGQLWPRIHPCIYHLLPSLPPIQSQTLNNYGITQLKVTQINLGSVPARIDGIKVHSVDNNSEVVIDIFFCFSGDCAVNLNMDLRWPRLSIPLDLRNVSVKSGLRLILHPVYKELPILGGVSVSLLSRPMLDFDVDGLPHLLDLGGIKDLISTWLFDYVETLLVIPRQVFFQLSDHMKHPRDVVVPKGILNVILVEATDLENKDSLKFGLSDPYGVLSVSIDGTPYRFISSCIQNQLNVTWNFLCQVPVDSLDSVSDLTVDLFDKDLHKKDDHLGQCIIPKDDLKRPAETGEDETISKSLNQVSRGNVKLLISWSPVSLIPCNSREAVLTVFIDSCHNIHRSRRSRPKWVVKGSLGKSTKTSPVVIRNNNPVFEHRMVFLVEDINRNVLKLEVVDMKNTKSVGHLKLRCRDLLEMMTRESLSFVNKSFYLNTERGSSVDASMNMSVSLRYVRHTSSIANRSHVVTRSRKVMTVKKVKRMVRLSADKMSRDNFGEDKPPKKPPRWYSNLEGDGNIQLVQTNLSQSSFDRELPLHQVSQVNQDPQPPQGSLANQHPHADSNQEHQVHTISQAHQDPQADTNQDPEAQIINQDKQDHQDPQDQIHQELYQSSQSLLNNLENCIVKSKDTTDYELNGKNNYNKSSKIKTKSDVSVLLALTHNDKADVLAIKIHQVNNDANIKASKFYVKLFLINNCGFLQENHPSHKKKTKSIEGKSSKMVFDELLQFKISKQQLKNHSIEVVLCSKKLITRKKAYLGSCRLKLKRLARENPIKDWFILEMGTGLKASSFLSGSITSASSMGDYGT